MFDVGTDLLLFDEVAVNDVPAYRHLKLQSKSSSPVTVQLTTSSQTVRFQLKNENYEAMKRSDFADFLSLYNETFDLVGVISSVILEPLEEKDLIVWFRADADAFSHIAKGAHPVPFNGTLTFTATANTTGSSSTTNASSDAAVGTRQQQAQQAESIAVQFRASVYVSSLKLSSSELQVTMPPNKTQVVDFIATNSSSQPVYFAIRNQAILLRGLDVELYESDKFEEPKLGHRLLLDSYASMTFSLMLRSSTVSATVQQQYHTVLQCDNLRDSRNTSFLYVSVNVVAESQGDPVAFPDTSVNFGDVYRGTKTYANIRIQHSDLREDATIRLGEVDRQKCEGKISLIKGNVAVDELTVRSQKESQENAITILYQPSYDGDNKDASKKKFDVELFVGVSGRAHSQRVIIRCSAVLYTSTIVVSQRSLDFGDCQVGQSKRCTFQIENRSPLPGKVVVQLRSKIIQIEGIAAAQKNTGREWKEEFAIAPSASLPITLRITPQRVNPMYRKQLTIINASNPSEDRQVINIEANNMAPVDARLHDELYSWKCDLINMDNASARKGASPLWAISDVPLLIPYSVQSKVERPVVLQLRSTCPEIELFYSTDALVCDQLSTIAAEIRSFCLYGEGEDASYLTNESAEQLFRTREVLLRLLNEASYNIVKRILLEPLASMKVYVLIIRTASPPEPLTKEDGISVVVDGIEAPRFVRLSYRLCGTAFELNGQKTKNFGEVNIGVKKTTKLPIVNRCNSFLYLHLSKSRSVTAEHIRMENSDKQSIFLTIRPYASREVELTLYPGIKGVFQEKIRVTNILNIQNTITITLKAIVTKADTFEISPDSWTFEMTVPPPANAFPAMTLPGASVKSDESGEAISASAAMTNTRVGAKFTVSNTSNTHRQIIVRADLSNSAAATETTASNPYLSFAGVRVAAQLEMSLSGAGSLSSRKLEEQIEKLEQKLKIYMRKKKTEKAENAIRKIEAYKLALKGEEVDLRAIEAAQAATQNATDHDLSESEDEANTSTPQMSKNKIQQSDIVQLLRREGVALPLMGAGESVMLTLFVACKRITEAFLPATQTHTMNLLFYEARDQEANRIIPIDVVLMRSPIDCSAQLSVVGVSSMASPVEAVHQLTTSLPAGLTGPSGQKSSEFGKDASAASAGITSPARAPQSGPSPSIHLAIAGAHGCSSGGRFHSTFMGHPLLVLRNCIVNDQTEFSFLVESDLDTTIVVLEPRRCAGSVVEVLDARFKLFPRNGRVSPQEPLRIVVECTARSVGPQKYFIPVKNIRSAAELHYLSVEMNPTEEVEMITIEPRELRFRDVITPCSPSQLEAQLIQIRSRFPFPHALVVRTNRPSQLALFEDATCTVPLLHPIRRFFVKETVRVYVQLRPGVRYVDPRARHVCAGVLVEAVAPNPAVSSTAFCVVGKAVLRTTAYIGSGLVEVPHQSLDLGCLSSTQNSIKTHITMLNTSHTFPLRVALVPSSPLVELGEETGAGNEITLPPLHERVMPLIVHLGAPGLTREFVDVVNRSNGQEAIRVSIRALRMNEGIVQVDPAVNTRLVFPVVAVLRGEQGRQPRLYQPVSCSVKLANYHSHREVVLATVTTTDTSRSLQLWFHTSDEESKIRVAFDEEQRQALEAVVGESRTGTAAPALTPAVDQPLPPYAKGRVELNANRVQTVMWTLTELPPLTAEEAKAILQYRMVNISATLQVYVTHTAHSARTSMIAAGRQTNASASSPQGSRYRGPTVGQCVLLVPITLSVAMSEGRAEPAIVNLGLVGMPTSTITTPVTAASSTSSDDEEVAAEGKDALVTEVMAKPPRTTPKRHRHRSGALRLPRESRYRTCHPHASKLGLHQSSNPSVVVTFHLVNLSGAIPLPLKVECPPVLCFAQTRLTIPPGESIAVEATLNLKLISTQGPFRYEAFFVNECNPENDMAVCVTGQHYWKVFQVLRADTQEEVRESLTLAPLRVEPSLQALLAEMKLIFVATEPDVEFDLRMQLNPQLNGLLELLLLHYDATSEVKHLNFHTEVAAAPPSQATTNVAAGTLLNVSSPANPSTALANPSIASNGPSAPSAVTVAAGSPAPLGLPASSISALTAAGISPIISIANVPPGALPGVISTGAAAGGVTSGGSTGSITPVEELGAAASTTSLMTNVTASKVAHLAAASTKLRRNGTSTATGASGSSSTGASVSARSMTLRLRCLLRGGDLSSLVSLFFGYRKTRAMGASPHGAAPAVTGGGVAAVTSNSSVSANGPSEVPGVGGSVGTGTWFYDRFAELERRSTALVSNNVWLGTFSVANPFTEVEEVQVYGTLAPFRTFTVPSKVVLRPCQVGVEFAAKSTTNDTAPVPVSTGGNDTRVGYVGEICVTNDYDGYVAEISVVVLVHERLSLPLCVDVRGGSKAAGEALSPPTATPGERAPSPSDASCEDGSGASADVRGTSAATLNRAVKAVTSFVVHPTADGRAPVSLPHCIRLDPHEKVVLTVVIRPAETQSGGQAPFPESSVAPAVSAASMPFSLPSLEQFVSVVVVDDNVPFSYSVCRVNVLTPANSAECLPNVILTADGLVLATPGGTAGRTVEGDNKEGNDGDPQGGPTPLISKPGDSTGAPAVQRRKPSASAAALEVKQPLSRPGSAPNGNSVPSGESAAAPSRLGEAVAGLAVGAPVGSDETGVAPNILLSHPRHAPCESEAIIRDASPLPPLTVVSQLPVSASSPHQWVLSLRNCEAFPGCGGAYRLNFSVPRGDTYEPNIQITNHAPLSAVHYAVQVVSQSPQVWLLLTSTTGVLEVGETQPLRLQVLSSEVGSFVGYVAITNLYDTREVVYLRLNAEVFVPGTAEGVFDVVAMNGGHRLATTNAVHSVHLGAVYGAGATRILIALEIINNGSVALEFPVSVVHPIRQEVRPIPPSVWYGNSMAATGQRPGYEAIATHARPTGLPDNATAAPNSASHSLPDNVTTAMASSAFSPASHTMTTSASLTTVTSASATLFSPLEHSARPPHHTSRSHHHHHHRPHGTSGGTAEGAATGASTAVPPSLGITALTPFTGKIVVCQIHSVPTFSGQKYFVVDPRSPLRLAFVLYCTSLLDIPDGYGVFGQTDVVFRCVQARDAHFTFNVKFEAYPPTFSVPLEYDMDAIERMTSSTGSPASPATANAAEAVNAETGVSASAVGLPTPHSSSFTPVTFATRFVEVEVAVTNLSSRDAQTFVLYTQSEVLSLSVPDATGLSHSLYAGGRLLSAPLGSAAESEGAGLPSTAASGGQGGSTSGASVYSSPKVELVVAPRSVGVFLVRLDRLRAEVLLKFDKDVSSLARPALCEHAFLYNKSNPRERVKLLFRQNPVQSQPRRQTLTPLGASLTGPPSLPAVLSTSTIADAKPVKCEGQHFSERHILSFAQRFSAVLTSLMDQLPFVSRSGDAAGASGALKVPTGANAAGTGASGGSSGNGGDTTIVGGSASASTMNLLRMPGRAGITSVGVGSSATAAAAAHGGRHPGGFKDNPGRHRPHMRPAGRQDAFGNRELGESALDTGSTTSSSTTRSSTSGSDTEDSDTEVSEREGVDVQNHAQGSALAEPAADKPQLLEEGNGGDERTVAEVEGLVGEKAVVEQSTDPQLSSDGAGSDSTRLAPPPLSSQSRHRSSESFAGKMMSSYVSSPLALAMTDTRVGSGAKGDGAGGGDRSSFGSEGIQWCDTLLDLQDLLVELTWLCDELLFYSVLLRNSRHVDACGTFLVSAVSQHPVMVAWRRRRGGAARYREYDIFDRFLGTLDALPRLSSTGST